MPLLDHEMLFVTGKGGAGKTTVAAALALRAARAGMRTLVCELAGQARIPAVLGRRGGAPGEEVHVEGSLWATTIASSAAMEEWISRILGSRHLTRVLVRSNFFRTFAEAAPGARELGEIVKVWELAQPERWDARRPAYDLVVVDGPASGNAIGMLRTPGTFADIARVGPIASQSARVRAWLSDRRRVGYVAVALAAELAVSETLDLERRLHTNLGRELHAVLVNGVLPDRFTAADLDRVTAAAGREPLLPAAVRAAGARADAQREQLERLRFHARAPVAELPFLFTAALHRQDVESLAQHLPVP